MEKIMPELEQEAQLKIAAQFRIEDPRGHSPETLRRLREALASDAPVNPDARRPNFFEVQAEDQVFYIHISPITQRITLLATWACEPEFEIERSA
jgi:hypothetical protein